MRAGSRIRALRLAAVALAAGALAAAAGALSTAHSQFARADRRPPTIGKLYPGQLPPGPGRELATRSCLKCHSASMITQQRKDAAAWGKTLAQMVAWGVELSDAERARLGEYLVRNFGPRR